MTALTVGALFAGYGGIEQGLSQVIDTDLRWYAEFDKGPAAIMAHHHPDVPNLWDVTKVDWSSVEPVDVITGGSPCQDLSHAGKRKGMRAGTRSGLWASMCDAIDIIRPRLVVWENVQGALSAEADSELESCPRCVGDPRDRGPVLRALGRVLGDLSELGYDARWYGLRAADVGAAHGRFRIFLFAQPADADVSGLEGLRGPTGAAPTGRHGHAESGPGRPDLTLLGTPRCADGMMHDLRENVGDPRGRLEDQVSLLPTPRATDGTKGGPNQRGSSGDLMLPSAVNLLPTPRTQNNENRQSEGYGGERGNFYGLIHGNEKWGDYAAAIARAEATFAHRPAPDPTEPNAKGGHRLSPRFVEWLMGLPEGHVTDVPGITRNVALKALGNGVCPPQIAAAFRAYVEDESRAAA